MATSVTQSVQISSLENFVKDGARPDGILKLGIVKEYLVVLATFFLSVYRFQAGVFCRGYHDSLPTTLSKAANMKARATGQRGTIPHSTVDKEKRDVSRDAICMFVCSSIIRNGAACIQGKASCHSGSSLHTLQFNWCTGQVDDIVMVGD